MIYYTWAYRRLLLDLLGCQAKYLVAVDARGNFCAVMPLMAMSGPLGLVYNSLPFFGSYGGVLARDAKAESIIWANYSHIVEASGVAAATVVMNPLQNGDPPISHQFMDQRIGQFTTLSCSGDVEAALLATIDSTARRNIKAALKAGIKVQIENDALPDLEAIHRENIQAIGGRVKPSAFFTLLNKHFTPDRDYRLYVARLGQEIVGTLLLFYAGQVVDYFIPGTRLEYRQRQPSALLLFRAMTDAARAGFPVWNWGGTWLTQENILRFKRKWGAQDRIYRYFTNANNHLIYKTLPKDMLRDYGYFFLLPFNQLDTIKEKT